LVSCTPGYDVLAYYRESAEMKVRPAKMELSEGQLYPAPIHLPKALFVQTGLMILTVVVHTAI